MRLPLSTETVRPGRALRVLRLAPIGPASGTTVFLVHGSGGRAEQWRRVWPALQARGHAVVAFDALGHGASATPRDWAAYRGCEWVAGLRTLVEAEGRGRQVLVGHSYGSLVVAAALAEGLPGTQGALLLAPPPARASHRAPWFAYLPVPLLERLRPGLSAGFRAAAWGPEAAAALVDEETAIADRNPFHVVKALWRQRLSLAPETLAHVRVPVQLLAGEADRLTPPALAQALASQLPQATVHTLPRRGHQLPLEAPDEVASAIQALAGWPAG